MQREEKHIYKKHPVPEDIQRWDGLIDWMSDMRIYGINPEMATDNYSNSQEEFFITNIGIQFF